MRDTDTASAEKPHHLNMMSGCFNNYTYMHFLFWHQGFGECSAFVITAHFIKCKNKTNKKKTTHTHSKIGPHVWGRLVNEHTYIDTHTQLLAEWNSKHTTAVSCSFLTWAEGSRQVWRPLCPSVCRPVSSLTVLNSMTCCRPCAGRWRWNTHTVTRGLAQKN